MIVEVLDPTYLKSKVDNIDIPLSTHRDAITNAINTHGNKIPSAISLSDNISNPTTTLIGSAILGFDGTVWRRVRVDNNGYLLTSMALDKIKIWDGTDYLEITSDGKISVQNIDVALSTRLSESTFTNTIQHPIGQVQTDVVGSSIFASAVIDSQLPSRMPYCIANINVSTTESSTSIAPPGAKILVLKNLGDNNILVGLNSSVPSNNPLIIKGRTIKIITHVSVTSIYYKTQTGTSILDIEYYN